MQVETQTVKSDPVSVREGATKLLDAFRRSLPAAEAKASDWPKSWGEADRRRYVEAHAIRSAAEDYNIRSDYAGEIHSVYKVLVSEVHQSALPA
jgi:hypothetical protein